MVWVTVVYLHALCHCLRTSLVVVDANGARFFAVLRMTREGGFYYPPVSLRPSRFFAALRMTRESWYIFPSITAH